MKKEVKIGIFGLAMLLCFYWGVNFLKGRGAFNRNKTYYAYYDNVSGIQLSSPVIVRGVKVGLVSDISYDPEQSEQVRLALNVKSKYEIPDNSVARIFTNGFIGGKAVRIDYGDSQVYLKSGDQIESEEETDFLDVAGSELEFFKQRAKIVVDNLTVTLENINALLADNGENIRQTVENLDAMSGVVRGILVDEADNVRNIIDNLDRISSMLADNSGKIDGTLTNLESITDSLRLADLGALVDELEASLGRLNSTVGKIDSGEGTVGKLVNDTALYDSLTSASANLSLLLEDIRNNPRRYLHFSVFGGGKKNR